MQDFTRLYGDCKPEWNFKGTSEDVGQGISVPGVIILATEWPFQKVPECALEIRKRSLEQYIAKPDATFQPCVRHVTC